MTENIELASSERSGDIVERKESKNVKEAVKREINRKVN